MMKKPDERVVQERGRNKKRRASDCLTDEEASSAIPEYVPVLGEEDPGGSIEHLRHEDEAGDEDDLAGDDDTSSGGQGG